MAGSVSRRCARPTWPVSSTLSRSTFKLPTAAAHEWNRIQAALMINFISIVELMESLHRYISMCKFSCACIHSLLVHSDSLSSPLSGVWTCNWIITVLKSKDFLKERIYKRLTTVIGFVLRCPFQKRDYYASMPLQIGRK